MGKLIYYFQKLRNHSGRDGSGVADGRAGVDFNQPWTENNVIKIITKLSRNSQ